MDPQTLSNDLTIGFGVLASFLAVVGILVAVYQHRYHHHAAPAQDLEIGESGSVEHSIGDFDDGKNAAGFQSEHLPIITAVDSGSNGRNDTETTDADTDVIVSTIQRTDREGSGREAIRIQIVI